MEVESDSGEFVIRKGESEDGVYFVWKGEAEVRGDAEEKIGPEFQLKRYDYFGNGARTWTSEQQVDVIASSKLICLVLPPEHTALLWPKSIWSADERYENNAPLESILHLEPIEINLFQGNTSPDVFGVFGGQFIGQALAAASKTVDCLKTVHHLQAYFLLVGDSNIPIGYEVHHLQDGKSFSRRRVDALQNGNIVFTLLASFQREKRG